MNAAVSRAERCKIQTLCILKRGNDFLTLFLSPSLSYQKGSSTIEHFWERIYESEQTANPTPPPALYNQEKNIVFKRRFNSESSRSRVCVSSKSKWTITDKLLCEDTQHFTITSIQKLLCKLKVRWRETGLKQTLFCMVLFCNRFDQHQTSTCVKLEAKLTSRTVEL